MICHRQTTSRDLSHGVIDFVIGVLAALTVLRGWRRGVLRELVSVVLLALVALFSFRLGPRLGSVIESWAGVSSLAARFVAVSILSIGLMSGAVWVAGRVMTHRAAVDRGDQLGGVALSMLWLGGVLTLTFYILTALPLNEDADQAIDESSVAGLLVGEGSTAANLVNVIAGDRVLEALVNLDQLVGDRQVIIQGDEVVTIAASSDVDPAPEDALEVFELLNRARVEAGTEPLAFSETLATLAQSHAMEMYVDGYFSHLSPITGTVLDRVAAARIPFVIVGENLALAPTAASVHEGLMASPGHRTNLLDSRYRRVGIGAVSGPLGLMVVQVFTG